MGWILQKERVILPGVERGIDYGKPRYLLLKKGNLQLEWSPGQMSWFCLGQQKYYPGTLVVRDCGPAYDQNSVDIFEGGTCSKKRLAECADTIKANFKVKEIPSDLMLKNTYIWK